MSYYTPDKIAVITTQSSYGVRGFCFKYIVPVQKVDQFKILIGDLNATVDIVDNSILINPELIYHFTYYKYIPKTSVAFYLQEYDLKLPVGVYELIGLTNSHSIIDKKLQGSFKIGFSKGNYKELTLVSAT